MNDEASPPDSSSDSTIEIPKAAEPKNLPTRVYRGFDKLLNIVLLVMAGLWLVSWFFSSGKPPETLESQAAEAFASALPATTASQQLINYTTNAPTTRPMQLADFEALLATSQQKPTFLMVYASWCPHCKRLFGELNAAASNYGDAWQFAAVSIDEDPKDAEAFLANQTPLHLTSYVMTDKEEYRAIGDAMRALDLQFEGGIAPSIGVPYNVIFYKGKPIGEFQGAMPTEELRKLLTEITQNAKKTMN
jgi:thiol-disulfide isomerase/thioredoxin